MSNNKLLETEISTKSQEKIKALFGSIAPVYDFLNHVLSFGIDKLWRLNLVKKTLENSHFSKEDVLLDLAAGTMDVSVLLAKKLPQNSIIAMDLCQPMLAYGLKKIVGKFNSIYPVVGNGGKLPLADQSVSAITLSFGLRNMLPREVVFLEALRVLKPGGRLCVLEFSGAKKSILFGMYNLYLNKFLPFIGKLFSKNKKAYQYLADSIVAFPEPEDLAKEMIDSGFSSVNYESYTFGIVSLHSAFK